MPASPSRKTATCLAPPSSSPLGSRRKLRVGRYWWRTRCAGCVPARGSTSATAGSSWRRASRTRCGCTRPAGRGKTDGAAAQYAKEERTMRRIVTGMTAEGKSVIVSDEEVQPIPISMAPGVENYLIWGADETVQLPTDGSALTAQAVFPSEGGFRFGAFTVPPVGMGPPADLDMAAGGAGGNPELPGMVDGVEMENPGMRRTT